MGTFHLLHWYIPSCTSAILALGQIKATGDNLRFRFATKVKQYPHVASHVGLGTGPHGQRPRQLRPNLLPRFSSTAQFEFASLATIVVAPTWPVAQPTASHFSHGPASLPSGSPHVRDSHSSLPRLPFDPEVGISGSVYFLLLQFFVESWAVALRCPLPLFISDGLPCLPISRDPYSYSSYLSFDPGFGISSGALWFFVERWPVAFRN